MSDVLDLVRDADPLDVRELERWHDSERGREMLARIVSTATKTRRSFRLRIAIASGVAAAIVLGVVLVPTIGRRPGASAAAAAKLNAAARVAERQPPVVASPGGYRYARSENAWRAYNDACSFPQTSTSMEPCPRKPPNDWAFSFLRHSTREIWVAPDGSGRLVTRGGEPMFFGPRDRATWQAAGSPPLDRAGTHDETFGPGELTYADFSRYPTDVDDLYDTIHDKAEGYGPSLEGEMLVLVGDLLRETGAPPRLRAALFRVAAKIRGVELVGDVTDPAGRRGVAVARTSDDAGFMRRVELIFDPETSDLLAEREILLERVPWADANPGTVIGYSVYLESGVVGSTQARP